MKKRRGIGFGGVFIIACLVSGTVLAGLFFYQFSDLSCGQAAGLEQDGDTAFAARTYSKALRYWLRVPEKARTAVLCNKIGIVYLKLSNLDQAALFFESAAKKDPLDLAAQKQILRICLLKGDIDGAEKKLSELKDLAASDPDVITLSGDLFLLKGDLERAKADYTLAMEFSPGQHRAKIKLAICLVQQQETGLAETLMAEVSAGQVKNASDFMLAADYYLVSGDVSKAEAFIRSALDMDPGNLDVKIRLARFYRTAGMPDKAEQFLKQLAGQYPDNAGFKLMLADVCLSRLDLAEAEKWLDMVRKLRGGDIGYHLLMGKFWMFKGRYSHAVSHVKAALDRNYGLVSAHYLLGVAYLAGGQGKLAETALIHALMINPDHVDALVAMAGLHYKNRDYKLARQYLDRVLSIEISSPVAWQIKGLCLMEQGEFDAASTAFSRAWHLGGKASSLLFLAQSFEGRNLHQTALDTYKAVLDTAPDMVEALHRYSSVLADTGRGGQALDFIDRWIEQGKTAPGVYYAGARLSLDMKQYKRCRAYIDRAMAAQPAAGEWYLLLADLHRQRGEDGEVEKALQACTADQPMFSRGWSRLASYYMARQQTGLAKQTLESAVNHFPDDPQITGNLAWILLEEGSEKDRALELARKAYDQMPDQAWLMDTLGWAYYHKKAYGQAGWMLAQAAETAPDNGLIQYHLGMTYYKQGKLLKAKERFQAAQDCGGIGLAEKENITAVLSGLNGRKDKAETPEIRMFDLDDPGPMVFPDDPNDEDDILKPDWSHMKNRS